MTEEAREAPVHYDNPQAFAWHSGFAAGVRHAREAAVRVAVRRGHGLDHSLRYSAAEVKEACYDIANQIGKGES